MAKVKSWGQKSVKHPPDSPKHYPQLQPYISQGELAYYAEDLAMEGHLWVSEEFHIVLSM